MTVKELKDRLVEYDDDTVVVCADDDGGWDNITGTFLTDYAVIIEFGGGSPFSDDK